jgi:lipopolysaccharide/colanic/teichoic acid biosynthesis glycosyltransferase
LAELSAGMRARLVVKRTFDVACALFGLLLIAPAMALVAVIVKLDSPGPVLFRQIRVGAGGRRFNIIKFRTMVRDAERILEADSELREAYEANDFKLSVEEDPRVTRAGRWLRRMSLDELPQLWNVLWGDMSLVGARPVPENHFAAFGPAQYAYTRMRPGVTGYWQVNGRNLASMEESNDFYLHNWSLWLDVRILARTVPAVLARRGAH